MNPITPDSSGSAGLREGAVYQRYFLSPHPNDIAFSSLASLINPPATSAVIITVFDNSTFTLKPKLSQEQTNLTRKAEDRNFAAFAKCDLVSLDFPDSRYRVQGGEHKVEPKDDELDGQVLLALGELLEPAIAKGAAIYLPLGNSEHLDHLIVRDAVLKLHLYSTKTNLFFYEDLPYANKWSETEIKHYAQKVVGPAATPMLVDLSATWHKKLAALRCYESQIENSTIPAMYQHAQRVSKGGSLSERLWYLPLDDQPRCQVIDTLAWVSWEACRVVGGCGVVISSIIDDPAYQAAVGRTLLIGPIYMPRDCIEYDPEEDIETLAFKLNSKILYRSHRDACSQSLPSALIRKFKEIECRHGVELGYLRDIRTDHHNVERLLINLSAAILPRRVYSPSLNGFLDDLLEKFGLDLRFELVRERTAHSTATLTLDSIRHGNPFDNPEHNTSKKRQINKDFPRAYGHVDNDYTYGVSLAQPAADALCACLEKKERCVLVVQDYMSLPTAYAIKLSENIATANISTLYFASGVSVICDIVEGNAEPAPTESTIFGSNFTWEAPIRCLINLTSHLNGTDSSIPESGQLEMVKNDPRRTLLDFEEFRHLAKWAKTRILQHGWKLDCVMPVSLNTLEELLFLDPGFTFTDQQKQNLFYHGVSPISCTLLQKRLKKQILLRYATREWRFPLSPGNVENTIVLTRTGRAVAAKSMKRDIAVVECLGQLVPDRNYLLIIITNWDNRPSTVVQGLLQEAKDACERQKNIFIRVVNAFSWPNNPEPGCGPTFLLRDDIHRAADVNLCLSSYDSYNVAAFEGLTCGSIAVISTSCGAARRVQMISGFESNVILVDYVQQFEAGIWVSNMADLSSTSANDQAISKVFQATSRQKEDIEVHLAEATAKAINALLPSSDIEREKMLTAGREMASVMSWTTGIREALVPCLEKLSARLSKCHER